MLQFREMKLSIITICYNNPGIEATCQSIVNQTWQDFEWLVIDGGSTNLKTLAILKKYRSRMDYFVSEKDRGRYHAMNKGIKKAKGEYLLFLNAGDSLIDAGILKKVVPHLKTFDIIYGDTQFEENGKRTEVRHYPDRLPTDYFVRYNISHQSTFVKHSLFEKYGLYNEDNLIVSDLEKWVELINVDHCSYQHLSLVISVYNNEGVSSRINQRQYEERKKIINQYFPQFWLPNYNGYRWRQLWFAISYRLPRKIYQLFFGQKKTKQKFGDFTQHYFNSWVKEK